MEVGEALVGYSPFAPPFRVHCRSMVAVSGVPDQARPTIGIDPLAEITPKELMGTLLVQEGVAVSSFTARLPEPMPPITSAARFDLTADRAWGIVEVRRDILNVTVIGGGLPGRELWEHLREIVLRDTDLTIGSGDLTPIVTAPEEPVIQLPILKQYRIGTRVGLVTRPLGPVRASSRWVRRDAEWEEADVVQQREGLTQLLLHDEVDRGPASAVVIRMPRAA